MSTIFHTQTNTPTLSLLGIGIYLPPAFPVRELVARAGGDATQYEGWDNIRVARDEDHPSTMAASALAAALKEADVAPQQLKLVISTGVSRDYVPSWSIAVAVMRELEIPHSCFGFDLTVGCASTLTAFNLAMGWLAGAGGGYAAIITAERWSHTVDRSATPSKYLWAHSDGAAAAVVALGPSPRALVSFKGAAFASNSGLSDQVLIKYGGTRHPIAPPGVNPFYRQIAARPSREVWAAYAAGYGRTFTELRERFDVKFARLLCNQISPNMVTSIGAIARVADDRVYRTGDANGHVGAADVLIGLRELVDSGRVDGPLAFAASAPYAYGAGLLVPG